MKKLGPYIHDPDGRLASATTKDFSIAVNEFRDGEIQGAWHQDATVEAATILSAQPKKKNQAPLNSVRYGGDAGSLALEIGGYIHTYDSRDCIIFSGSLYHSPVSVAALDSNPGNRCVGRYSYAIFLNKK